MSTRGSAFNIRYQTMYHHGKYIQFQVNKEDTVATGVVHSISHKPEDQWSCKRSPDILA